MITRKCDNYSNCGQEVTSYDPVVTDDEVRRKGWRVWRGLGLTGKELDVTLCDVCVENTKRPRPPTNLQGQLELFEE